MTRDRILSPAEMEAAKTATDKLAAELGRAILGQEMLQKLLLTAIFARGHVLLEGLPGLGKTAMINAVSKLMSLKFRRIQFTPDLMPGDILGTHILQESGKGIREMVFQEGPVFTNLLLADEINRASPKTQSALLEAMQEHTVTMLGERRKLPNPFFVLATQNPIELEGTYPLPEAQLDRFLFKLDVPVPDEWVMERIITERHRGEVPNLEPVIDHDGLEIVFATLDRILIPSAVSAYIARLVRNCRPDSGISGASERIRYGASPRAAIAMAEASRAWALIEGRPSVGFADIEAVAKAVLRHRIVLDYRAKSEKISTDDVIRIVIAATPALKNEVPGEASLEK